MKLTWTDCTNLSKLQDKQHFTWIWDSHDGDHEQKSLLGCNAEVLQGQLYVSEECISSIFRLKSKASRGGGGTRRSRQQVELSLNDITLQPRTLYSWTLNFLQCTISKGTFFLLNVTLNKITNLKHLLLRNQDFTWTIDFTLFALSVRHIKRNIFHIEVNALSWWQKNEIVGEGRIKSCSAWKENSFHMMAYTQFLAKTLIVSCNDFETFQ
jgi:hypothetical protein